MSKAPGRTRTRVAWFPAVTMLRFILCAVAVSFAWPLRAAERRFDFSGARLNEPPPGFHSTVSGEGKPGEWKVIEEDNGPSPAPPGGKPPVTPRHPVLAQLSRYLSSTGFLTTQTERGNLPRPLRPVQALGIWPTGDYRTIPTTLGPTYALAGAGYLFWANRAETAAKGG